MAETDIGLVPELGPQDSLALQETPEPASAEEQARVADALESGPQTNFFAQFRNDPDAKDPELYERARLHFNDAFYRGTLNGSSLLTGYAKVAYPDDPEAKDTDVFPDLENHLNPLGKATRKEIRDRYEGIVGDLARYDAMRPFGDTFEFLAAGGGSFAGGMMSPESIFARAGKAASAVGRIAYSAFEQGTIQAATDPVVQFFGNKGGVQDGYDPWRTATNSGFGVIAGGGLVGIGELIPSARVKEIIGDLATEDKSFARPDVAPTPEAPKAEPLPEAPQPQPGPTVPAQLLGEPVTGMPAHAVAAADGSKVDVTPIVVEARDLKTSADAGYDASLQPRDRERAASEAQVRDISANLSPERLGVSSEADRGAPIIGPDGMVESGNGRTQAIRQAYEQNSEAAQRYRDFLASQGVDVSKYEQPVLVRQRTTQFTPEQRQAFTVAANQGATLTMSAPERALADSRLLDSDALDLIRNPDDLGAINNRDFVRNFVSKLPQAEQGMMTAADGTLSAEGLTRVRNAVLAKAYGDAHILTRIAEATSDEIKSISNALVSVAPDWAKLRADVSAGLVRRDVDLTAELIEAVGRTADLRARGTKLDTFLAQQDAFDKLSDPVEAFMRMFYDKSGKRAAAQARIADGLRFYAEEARKVSAEKGLDLGLPDVTFRDIQKSALDRSRTAYDNEAGQGGLFLRGRARDVEGSAAGGRQVRGSGSGEGRPGVGAEGDSLALRGETGPRADELALAQRRGGGTLKMEQRRPQAGIQQPNAVQGTGKLPAGVAQSESPIRDAAVKSLQQQTMALAKALDIPLRQGRVTLRNALGIFKPGSGVVRVKEVPDFEVVAHELGHAIEARAGKPLTALTQQFSTELAPLVSNASAYKPSQHVMEGFAEWVRRYIGNPANAKQVAPGFAIAFENFMQANHPEVLQILKDASAEYRRYLEAPSVDALAAIRRSRAEEARGWGKVKEFIKENGFTQSIKLMMQKAYTALLDDKAPVARSVRELARIIKEQNGGKLVELKAADNPEVLLRLSARSHQAAMHDMMDGVYGYHSIHPEGPSLFDALAKATGKPSAWGKWDQTLRDKFSDYLIARRGLVLWDKFERGDLANPPMSISKADNATSMAELDKQFPNFREASDMVHAWTRKMLTKQYEGHLIGEETFYKLMDEPFYVPFMRNLSDRPLSGESSGRGEQGASRAAADTIKKMKGSSRDILDPIESLMTQAFLINRTLKHNDVILALEKLSTKAYGEGGKYFEEIPAKEMHRYTFDLGAAVERAAREHGMDPVEAKALASSMGDMMGADDPIVGSFFKADSAKPRGEPIVFYKKNGEMKAGRVMSVSEGHALYETITALPEKYSDLWVQLIAGVAAVKRASIVTELVFALTNYIRDQFASAILRSDYIPIVSGIRGIVSEFKQGEAARGYAIGGGVSPGASVAQVEKAIEKDVNALAKKGYLVNRVSSLHGLLELTAFTEAGTRNSIFAKVFKAKRAQGLSEYEALIEAAYQAQDILDFSRHGSRMLAIKKLLPFINAQSQGLDKAKRTIFDPIARKITGDQVLASDAPEFRNAINAAVKVFGVGGVLGAAWAAINSDSEAYKDASPYLKGTHLVVPWGRNVIVVPKPFELSIGMTAGEYAFQAWQQDDPRMAEQFVKAAWTVLSPPDPLTDIPGISTAIQLEAGKSLFTGRDIVPDRLQRLPANQQYTDRTSSIAKYIGDLTGVSPMKVDFAIGDLFGTWGRDVQVLSQGIDSTHPAQSLEDRMFIRRLVKDPNRTSDVTVRFWNYMGQTTGKYNQDVAGYDALVKGFNDTAAQQFLDNLPTSEKAWVTLQSAANEDGKPAFNADEKRLHPLRRAYDAVTLLNGLRREMVDDTFHTFEKGERMSLSPTARRDLIEGVRELQAMEMRNAFVIMKEPGYANRQLFDTEPVLEKIKAISPEVAEEIRTRYATSKIYTTKSVAEAYPEMQKSLLRDGSEAELADLAADAKAEGWAFGGERIPRPKKRRIPIPAAQ